MLHGERNSTPIPATLRSGRSMRRYVPAAIVGIAGVLLSVGVFLADRAWEQQQIGVEFQREAENYVSAIRRELQADLDVIAMLGAFFAASEHVELHEFRTFADRALLEHLSLHALEWSPRIPHAQRESFERSAREIGLPNYRITELALDQGLETAEAREEYFPVLYIRPYRGREAVVGYDMASESRRRAVMERARDTGEIVMTPPVALVSDPASREGFILFRPVYHEGTDISTVEGRRANLEGFVMGVIRIDDLIAKATSYLESPPINMQVADRSSDATLSHKQATVSADLGFTLEDAFSVGGRTWRVTCWSTPEYLAQHRTRQPWYSMSAGLAFTACACTIVVAGVGRRNRIEMLVRERTAELERVNRELAGEIRERRLADEALARSNAELKVKNQDMEQFVYTVSHDLKSPIVTMQGFLNFLRQDLGEGRHQDAMDSIQELEAAAKRMATTIADLLQLCRIGRTVLDPEPVEMNALIRRVIDNHRLELTQRGVQLTVASDFPVIEGDADRLVQVFDNLLANALKHGCAEGEPRIEFGWSRHGDEARFVVRDNGPGIDPKYQERIFALFERLNTASEGSGVGLAIVRRIAEGHGGRAWVESKPGDGAAFFVALPVCAAPAADLRDDRPPQRRIEVPIE